MKWILGAVGVGLFIGLLVWVFATRGPEPKPPAPIAAPRPPPPSEIEVPAEAVKWSWTSTSPTGKASIVQTAIAPKSCEIRCVRDPGQQELWKDKACLGTREQLRFVSEDCERVLLIDPAPALQGTWGPCVAVTAFARGTAKAQLLLTDLFEVEGKLVLFPDSVQWLAGGRKVPAPSPKLLPASADEVELTLIDGRRAVVNLDGQLVSGGRVAPAPPAPAHTPTPGAHHRTKKHRSHR